MAARKLSFVRPNGRQRWPFDAVSRRALIGGASAAIMASAAPAGLARDILSGREGDLWPNAAAIALSAALWTNAQHFHGGALAAQDRFPRQAAYFLAIAIELSLKSYLLHRGFGDDWNRVHIGHDLRMALRCARRAGFDDVPPNLPAITVLLTPYYLQHAFDGMSPAAVAYLHRLSAHATVQALHHTVGAAVQGQEPIGMSALGHAET